MSLGGTYSNSAGANLKLKLYDDGVTANTYGLGVRRVVWISGSALLLATIGTLAAQTR